jgi:hypothetical protein
MIDLGADCDIDVTKGWSAPPDECVEWDDVTSDTIGECYSICEILI